MEPTDTDDDIDIRGDPASLPPTLYVLELAAGVPAATVDWYISRVQGRRRTGGAELLVSAQPQLPGKGLVLHLTASRIKLLETAERMELRKKDRDGYLRDFTCAELDEFLGEGGVDGLLTMCEKQRIVLHELEHIRARSAEHQLPGYPSIQLFPGQSVTRLLLQEGIIAQLFPVHDTAELERLGKSWYAALFQRQPFEDIRAYFGESVALYFSFLGFYTTALCGPAALGLLQLVFSVDTLHEYALYSLFNMLWVTVFLEAWKRKCNELAYVWGVMDKTQMSFLEPRANHRGEMVRDEITGRYMPYYPRWKTLLKLYLVSIPVVVVCLFGSFYLMLVSFWAEEYLTLHRDQYGGNLAAVLIMLPSVIYSVVVLVLNQYYNKMTTFLTEWENHRTQKQFDYYRVIKLALFEFVNSFMSLFYIAFYIQDLEMLRGQLAVMLIIQQLVNNFQEALLPIVIRTTYSKVQEKVVTKLKEHKLTRKLFESRTLDAVDADDARVRVRTLEPDDPRVQDVSEQLQLEPYPDTSDDYLEMFVQFGYAFLFSSVFPMAAFWAVFNNLLEIRADAFKLCKVYQRPPAKSVRNIGAWMRKHKNGKVAALPAKKRKTTQNKQPVAGVRGARLRGCIHQLRAALHVPGAAFTGSRPHLRRVGGGVCTTGTHSAGAQTHPDSGGAQRAILDPQGDRVTRVPSAPAAAQEAAPRDPPPAVSPLLLQGGGSGGHTAAGQLPAGLGCSPADPLVVELTKLDRVRQLARPPAPQTPTGALLAASAYSCAQSSRMSVVCWFWAVRLQFSYGFGYVIVSSDLNGQYFL
ncbi:anoctamin-10-like isoform X3 [Amphibalanus amphitrite]|nr:anoctamin-10-like isoform X3 [Amphibalanus amphitrite]XP_043241392.1 anoctamin-10-like isoform X3 [Amphibalanus amphitrite]